MRRAKVRWLKLLLPLISAWLLILSIHFASSSHAIGQDDERWGSTRGAPSASDWGGQLPADTILDPADNPHIVNTDLVVPAGVTLTIEPGVELYFAPDASLIVYGRLSAAGTPTQTLLFTRRDAGTYWGAIAIIDSRVDNRITHAVIEYTCEGLPQPRSHGVSAYNSQVTLADSVLRYTQASAGVIADWNSTLYLLRNEIHDIQGDAVHPTGGRAVIQGNHIYHARGGSQPNEGIEISQMSPQSPALVSDNHIHDTSDECLDLNDSSAIIERNTLHHCADKGLSIGSAGHGGPPTSVTVVNNLIYSNSIGIAVKDNAMARIVHNTIAHNETDGLALYQDHVGLNGGRATVVNSILWHNARSISLDSLSTITVTYSDVEGQEVWPGEGNLNADPLFRAGDDFQLGEGSPAINAGLEQGIAVDLAGRPRPVGSAPDMGAYEVQALLNLAAWPGDERIHLAWRLVGREPALASFAISSTLSGQGSAAYPGTLVLGLPTTTLAYTLTDLVNYAWYTVVVEGWDTGGDLLMRSNAVAVMPTDRYVYLPVVLLAHP